LRIESKNLIIKRSEYKYLFSNIISLLFFNKYLALIAYTIEM